MSTVFSAHLQSYPEGIISTAMGAADQTLALFGFGVDSFINSIKQPMGIINSLLPEIERFRMLGYWLVLLVSLLESLVLVGIIVPGAVFVIYRTASVRYFSRSTKR